MRPLSEIRRARLEELVAEWGTAQALADHLGKDRRQVSAWRADPKKKKGAKAMRDETAREIERLCLKPSGWMDHESGEALAEPATGSQPLGLDASILITAAGWVDFEIGLGEKIQGRDALLRRIAEIYPLLHADGGEFTPAHAYEFMKAAEMRNAATATRGKGIGKSGKGGRKAS